MNKVFLIGNLTRDPELIETKSGVPICRFSIAVNTRKGSETRTDFFNIIAWRGLGENVAKYCTKGSKVAIVGTIQLDLYDDTQGHKQQRISIVATEIEFLSTSPQNKTYNNEHYQKQSTKKVMLQPVEDDEELPFG